MPRPRKPWFRKSTGWWMVEIDGRQLRRAVGRERKAEAERKYHTITCLGWQRSLSTRARQWVETRSGAQLGPERSTGPKRRPNSGRLRAPESW